MIHQSEHQTADTIPRNLNADAEQQEGDDSDDAVGRLRRDFPRNERRVGVSEKDQQTDHEDGYRNAEVTEQIRDEAMGG